MPSPGMMSKSSHKLRQSSINKENLPADKEKKHSHDFSLNDVNAYGRDEDETHLKNQLLQIEASSIQFFSPQYEESVSSCLTAAMIGTSDENDNFTLVEDFINAQVVRHRRRRPKRTRIGNHHLTRKGKKLQQKTCTIIKSSSEMPKKEIEKVV